MNDPKRNGPLPFVNPIKSPIPRSTFLPPPPQSFLERAKNFPFNADLDLPLPPLPIEPPKRFIPVIDNQSIVQDLYKSSRDYKFWQYITYIPRYRDVHKLTYENRGFKETIPSQMGNKESILVSTLGKNRTVKGYGSIQVIVPSWREVFDVIYELVNKPDFNISNISYEKTQIKPTERPLQPQQKPGSGRTLPPPPQFSPVIQPQRPLTPPAQFSPVIQPQRPLTPPAQPRPVIQPQRPLTHPAPISPAIQPQRPLTSPVQSLSQFSTQIKYSDINNTYFIFNINSFAYGNEFAGYTFGDEAKINDLKTMFSILKNIGKIIIVSPTRVGDHVFIDLNDSFKGMFSHKDIYGLFYFQNGGGVIQKLVSDNLISPNHKVFYIDSSGNEHRKFFDDYEPSTVFKLDSARYGKYAFYRPKDGVLQPFEILDVVKTQVIPFFEAKYGGVGEKVVQTPYEQAKQVETKQIVESVKEFTVNQGNKILPAIQIGDVTFILDSRSVAWERELVGVTVNNTKIAYYRSGSETGLWRLCCVGSMGSLVKGVDYVTSSFVHIELQLFINKHYNTLPEDINLKDRCECSFGSDQKFRIINDRGRIYPNYKEPIFEILSNCKAGNCFGGDIGTINDVIEEIENVRGSITMSGIKAQVYTEFLSTYRSLCQTCRPFDKQIRAFYKTTQILMEKYFKVDLQSKRYLGSYKSTYHSSQVEHNIFSIDITSTITNVTYTLIYTHYTIYVKPGSPYNGKYYAVINVIPPDSKINDLGLYSKVMGVGVYIYKIFEYNTQCRLEFKSRSIEGDERCYIFIGDLLDNVWPFNILRQIDV